MKCIHCGHDSRYKDRVNQRCPQCSRPFAFEPRQGDPVTDRAFQNAIDRVSANGTVRFGIEHLYYEICRRQHNRWAVGCVWSLLGIAVIIAIWQIWNFKLPSIRLILVIVVLLVCARFLPKWVNRSTVTMTLDRFNDLWSRWCRAQPKPQGVILRQNPPRRRPTEPDIKDYSFDRAVICDRARTVDLLLANNFHFENNCAVLSVDGYPPGPFETVRTMLKRNPRLQVFVLHDATPAGCLLAHRIANDPDWFAGRVPVVDVGLRPIHAKPFNGLLLKTTEDRVRPGAGISSIEAKWLSKYALELAVIRPEQVLKRLFRAINRRDAEDRSDDADDDGRSNVETDLDSFGADASDTFDSGDSFG